MNIEHFIKYCESKPHVSFDTPFGPDTLVFRVKGKIFALTGLDSADFTVNLKCDPQKSQELRAMYEDIIPGYHMNKKHWNTIVLSGQLDWEEIQGLISHSYQLVSK